MVNEVPLNPAALGVLTLTHCGLTMLYGDATWQHKSGSTLAQVMASCLMIPRLYLNNCDQSSVRSCGINLKIIWHAQNMWVTKSHLLNYWYKKGALIFSLSQFVKLWVAWIVQPSLEHLDIPLWHKVIGNAIWWYMSHCVGLYNRITPWARQNAIPWLLQAMQKAKSNGRGWASFTNKE